MFLLLARMGVFIMSTLILAVILTSSYLAIRQWAQVGKKWYSLEEVSFLKALVLVTVFPCIIVVTAFGVLNWLWMGNVPLQIVSILILIGATIVGGLVKCFHLTKR